MGLREGDTVSTDKPVDLRSDTVTRPTPAMRKVMAEALVGDDVFRDDPTINRLEERTAELLGKPAAVFVPSGVMANQTAIRAHTEPGDQVIAHVDSHINRYESGAPAALCGVHLTLIESPRGIFDAEDVRGVLHPSESHYPPSKLIVLENTHNRGGGSIWPVEKFAAIRRVADDRGLKIHLDGARLMNASVAKSQKPQAWTQYADTVSMCFSKGLGAPVGSAVAGSAETIKRVRRFRKMFGGGMRQAGIIAAGALFAIENHIPRLAEDHENARRLGEGIANIPGLSIELDEIETNLLFFNLEPAIGAAAQFVTALREAGVWMLAEFGQRVRAVTHLDVSRADIDRAIPIIERVTRSLRK